MDKFTKMTQTDVRKLICTLAVPTIISMLVSAFYNMADTFFVGKIGTSASAAVGVAFPLMAVIQAVGFLFGHGSGNYISRQLGMKNKTEAEKMAATGLVLSFLAGILIALAGLAFTDGLAKMLGSTKTILPYSVSYIRYIITAAPFMTSAFVLNNQLRFQGSAVYGMIGITAGAVINIALDPLLIFVFNMGISGAALATALSQTISFFILLICCFRSDNIKISLKNFSPTAAHLKEIMLGGSPSLCRQGLNSISSIFLNHAAGLYGDAAIAAISIVTRITMFCSSALIGFGQGFQPVCGFNYGAKLFKRVRDAFWFAVKVASVFSAFAAVIMFIFAPQIISIFRDDPQVIAIGCQTLRFHAAAFPLVGWIVLCNMCLQNLGRAVRASFLAMSRQGLFLIPAVALLSFFFGLTGLEAAQPAADIVSFVFSVPIQLSVLKELRREELGCNP